jgi:hypothetical protein
MAVELVNYLGRLGMVQPVHGVVCRAPAGRWEDSAAVGNGTLGALVHGHPYREEVVLSHEALFVPLYPKIPYMDLPAHFGRVRELVMEGRGQEAMDLTVELIERANYPAEMFTDPFIGACSLHLSMPQPQDEPDAYARTIDFDTGESVVGWSDARGIFRRGMHASRADGLMAMAISSPSGTLFDLSLELARIERDLDEGFFNKVVKSIQAEAAPGFLGLEVSFNSFGPDPGLTGYAVGMRVVPTGGQALASGGRLSLTGVSQVLLLVDIQPSYSGKPAAAAVIRDRLEEIEPRYDELLAAHARIHGDMFRRVGFSLGSKKKPEEISELQGRSSVGSTDPGLVELAFDAGRYGIISSTGRFPPALQGIWTGTWKPNWSGDWTLNGNVQSAIAASLPGNHFECMRATLDYLSSLLPDFKANARGLFGFRGAFITWRASTHGQTHCSVPNKGFPGMYGFDATAWWAWYFLEYWLYTGDEAFFEQQLKPFYLEAAAFYEDYLSVERDGTLVLVPSYSPENKPPDQHCLQPNATITIAAIRQLLRTLLLLADKLGVDTIRQDTWQKLLDKMPGYRIDPNGALSEWSWPGVPNREGHRHASHLYPLFDGVAPEIASDPALREACRMAIVHRLEWRRGKNGGAMAFGLVQLGLSASNLRDKDLAYECVEWLVNRYWSPMMVPQHDPGKIFNLDIAGGLPAVIINMLVQCSLPAKPGSPWRITLLPCLPAAWPEGTLAGIRCRGGFEVSLAWRDGSVSSLRVLSLRGGHAMLEYNGCSRDVRLEAGESWSAPELSGTFCAMVATIRGETPE